ncbi:MAG: hypothetical protein QGH74_04760 [Candidatus Brocadiia bacterium]|jgi:hypothetical protein|nr:hypothetical protein [Candidatus Brocadiia bacterium]
MSGDALMVGFARRCITPPLGTELSGYGYYLDRRADEVLDDICVRCVALQQGRDQLVLISCDLLGFAVEFSDRLRRSVADDLGVPPASVLLACTHTHCAPASQPLEGLGEIDPAYLETVEEAIRSAAVAAAEDQQEAQLWFVRRTIEPIGYNRRNMSFEPIDAVLNSAIFRRVGRSICLASYACHAVTRCIVPAVSADWPGAFCMELERQGMDAIIFQGFCGDINPVPVKDAWGSSDPQPLGELLRSRALRALKDAPDSPTSPLRAAERRIRLPLNVLSAEEIEEQCRRHAAPPPPGIVEFMGWWRARALAEREARERSPWVDNVPVQAVRIGELRIVGLPGEIFCRIAAPFQARAAAFTFGFCGGNVGYIPTADAYDEPGDYAAWDAPRFYGIFPYSPRVAHAVIEAGLSVLKQVG